MSNLTKTVDTLIEKIDDELCVLSLSEQMTVLEELSGEIDTRTESVKSDIEESAKE